MKYVHDSGIVAMRICLCTISIAELLFLWGPEILKSDGILNENILPRTETIKYQNPFFSIYLSTSHTFTLLFLLCMHLYLLIKLMFGIGSIQFTAFFAWLFSISIHSRNQAATFGHAYLMDRSYLALALLSPQNTNVSTYGSRLFIFVIFYSMWSMHGWEKLMEQTFWWEQGNALLLSMSSDVAFPHSKYIAELMILYLPRTINILLCRFIVILEFPLGPVLLVLPYQRIRLIGLLAICMSLLSFGVFLNVDNLPWSCIATSLPLFPSIFWNYVENYVENNTLVKFIQSKKNVIKPVLKPTSTAMSKVNRIIAYSLNVVGFILTLITLFCAIRVSINNNNPNENSVVIVSKDIDAAILCIGNNLRISGGWKAFTPPPQGGNWFVAVGVPLLPTKWSNYDRGISIRFYDKLGDDWKDEGRPFDEVGWLPPVQHMLDLSETRWIPASHAFEIWNRNLLYNEGYECAREKLIEKLCVGFHSRHDQINERIEKIEIWEIGRELINVYHPGVYGQAVPTQETALLVGNCF